METFHNNSKVKFFSGQNLTYLQDEVNEFMLSTKKIYNVKHYVTTDIPMRADMHYIMVSYE